MSRSNPPPTVDGSPAANDRPPQPFPENELPKWLWRQLWVGLQRLTRAIWPPPYKELARFSHDFAMCAGSSADLTRGLQLCLKPLAGTRLGNDWVGVVSSVRSGSSLTEAFRAGERSLPPFYLPVVSAGEQSGRLAEAFHFLESHCNLLAGPSGAIRNLWLFPVVIMLFGSLLRVILHLLLGGFAEATSLLFQEILSWGQLLVIVAIVMVTPVRYFFDQLRLSLPLVGPFEREIALHPFFRIMALMYSVGGHRVEEMIRTAASSVSNHAARLEFLKAATAIERQESVPDAFRHVNILSEAEWLAIETGELSGTLESAFEQISDDTGASLTAKIRYIEPLLLRIVMFVVGLSVISTLLGLMM